MNKFNMEYKRLMKEMVNTSEIQRQILGDLIESGINNILAEHIAEWYADGYATWESRGAPGEDGMFGGSFHDISFNTSGEGISLNVDFGSADKESAIADLKDRLYDLSLSNPELKYELESNNNTIVIKQIKIESPNDRLSDDEMLAKKKEAEKHLEDQVEIEN